MRKNRFLIVLVFLAAVLMMRPVTAAGDVLYTNSQTGYQVVMEDGLDLLNDAEEKRLLMEMMPITDYCNVGFYTYNGASREYVMDKAKTWANSVFPGTCTLFIIDMATRQLAVWSSTDVQKTLTQEKCYTITDNVFSYASAGNYARCAETAFNQMYRALKGETVSGPMRLISNALLAVLAAILFAYLFISARMEQEVKVSLPDIATATVGAGAVIAAKKLSRKVKHSSSSGGGGFHGGGGFSGGGGGFGGGGGSHGF